MNMAKVRIPKDYYFPPEVEARPRDFKLSWLLIQEIGVAAVPPTEFYTSENAHMAEDYLRFAVGLADDSIDQAMERLRDLRKFIEPFPA